MGVPRLEGLPAVLKPCHVSNFLKIPPGSLRPPRLFFGFLVENQTVFKLADKWKLKVITSATDSATMSGTTMLSIIHHIRTYILNSDWLEMHVVLCNGASRVVFSLCSSWQTTPHDNLEVANLEEKL